MPVCVWASKVRDNLKRCGYMAGNRSRFSKHYINNPRQSGIFNKFDLISKNPSQPKLSYVGHEKSSDPEMLQRSQE